MVNVGDVVQIDPTSESLGAKFGACFATVTEVKSWGVKADVMVPGGPYSGGIAPVRIPNGDFAAVGIAAWMNKED